MTDAIVVEGLVKRFGRATALDGVDLDVARGEAFGLAGLNGAGKTTLIKCLLDFCSVDSGRIRILGVDHRQPRARAPLAFLPERFIPPYYLRGRDFLRYMLTLHGVPYRPAQAEAMLAALDLDLSALVKPVRAFSKGMTQKLGLAACLLTTTREGIDPGHRRLAFLGAAVLLVITLAVFLRSDLMAYDVTTC